MCISRVFNSTGKSVLHLTLLKIPSLKLACPAYVHKIIVFHSKIC